MSAGLLEGRGLPERFSLEKDFLEKECTRLSIGAFISSGYFLDIGLPEDYSRAQKDLPRLFEGLPRVSGGASP
jgi:D-glycero-alpha-D-manno-heptose 1-phosphate guanylyltransferase